MNPLKILGLWPRQAARTAPAPTSPRPSPSPGPIAPVYASAGPSEVADITIPRLATLASEAEGLKAEIARSLADGAPLVARLVKGTPDEPQTREDLIVVALGLLWKSEQAKARLAEIADEAEAMAGGEDRT